MHPILFQFGPIHLGRFTLGPFPLSTYGLMMATGFLMVIFYLWKVSPKEGHKPQVILDLAYYLILAGVVGSRIFYIFINYDVYLKSPLSIFKIWQGGLVFYGGLLGAFAVSIWYVRKHRLNFFSVMDTLIVALPLGQAFGRIGCFFAGCCYGRPAHDLPWAVTFTNPASLAMKGVPLHPSQLYASFFAFSLFVLLFVLKRHRRFEGQIFATYFMAYPFARLIEERFRGDLERKFLPLPGMPQLISTGDTVSILLFAFGLGLYLYLLRRHRDKAKP